PDRILRGTEHCGCWILAVWKRGLPITREQGRSDPREHRETQWQNPASDCFEFPHAAKELVYHPESQHVGTRARECRRSRLETRSRRPEAPGRYLSNALQRRAPGYDLI